MKAQNRPSSVRVLTVALGLGLLLSLSPAARAQPPAGGTVSGRVTQDAQPLAETEILLNGDAVKLRQVSDRLGRFHFPGLPPGVYWLTARRQGFDQVGPARLEVDAGRATTLEVRLGAAGKQLVCGAGRAGVADSPYAAGLVLSRQELNSLPTARDPWAPLHLVPGIYLDRVDVGGTEIGSQSTLVSGGARPADNDFFLDGVRVTDPAALGRSSIYFDFGALEQLSVRTGGPDATLATSGAEINLVTRRGGQRWRGDARALLADGDWQSDRRLDRSPLGEAGPWNGGNEQQELTAGSRLQAAEELGAGAGGPLLPGRLWIWGSYGSQQADTRVLARGRSIRGDREVESYSMRLDGRPAAGNSLNFSYYRSEKRQVGRNAGPTRPQETTWSQRGPTSVGKLEDSQLFSGNFYLTGLLSYVDGGFSLDPAGGVGPGSPDLTRGPDRAWRNSFVAYSTDREQLASRLDGNLLVTTGQLSHELKFGVEYRHTEVCSSSVYPGRGLVGRADLGDLGSPSTGPVYPGTIARDAVQALTLDQGALYAQDTFQSGRLTFDLGLRYDFQRPAFQEVAIPSSRAFPELFPGYTDPGGSAGFEWRTVSPRLGLTWALADDRRSLLSVSYSRYAAQLGAGSFFDLRRRSNQLGSFLWYDTNANLLIEPGEERLPVFPSQLGGRVNRVDPDLGAELTDEVRLGFERALRPHLVLGAETTWRLRHELIHDERLVVDPATGQLRPHRPEDYSRAGTIVTSLPNGFPAEVPVYRLNVSRDPAGGFLRRNSDREQELNSVSLQLTRRLANRWMARVYLQHQITKNEVPDYEIGDPTQAINDFGAVLYPSSGAGPKDEVWLDSTWSWGVSGLYQVAPHRRWGFDVVADLFGRQGYPIPYRVSVSGLSPLTGDGVDREVLLFPTLVRNDNLAVVNVGLRKRLQVNRFDLGLSLDVFNLLDEAPVLQTESFIAAQGFDNDGNLVATFPSDNGGHVREVLAPRTVRLGITLGWN